MTTIKNPEKLVTITKWGKRHFYPAVLEYGDGEWRFPRAPFRKAFDISVNSAFAATKNTMADEINTAWRQA